MRITCVICFVELREVTANNNVDRGGNFLKFQWKKKDFAGGMKEVSFGCCVGEDTL